MIKIQANGECFFPDYYLVVMLLNAYSVGIILKIPNVIAFY
jgi:hypothetical protein